VTVKPKEKGTIKICVCCGLPRSIYMDSVTAQQVCDPCKQHTSRDLQRNLQLHRDWWLEHAKGVSERNQAVASGLREQVAAQQERAETAEARATALGEVIDSDYANAPLGDLQMWVQSIIVKNAESRMRSAYRSRDSAMATLWRLDRLHRDGKSRGTCLCGKPEPSCRERKALRQVTSLIDRWEQGELERLKAGKDHGLPGDHPEVLKRSSRTFSSVYPR